MSIYYGEIRRIQVCDCKGLGASTEFGEIIREYDYTPYCWIPNVGTIMRLNAGVRNGLYKVLAVEFHEAEQRVRIKIDKY